MFFLYKITDNIYCMKNPIQLIKNYVESCRLVASHRIYYKLLSWSEMIIKS